MHVFGAVKTLAMPVATLQHPIQRMTGCEAFAFPGAKHEVRINGLQRIINGQRILTGDLPGLLCLRKTYFFHAFLVCLRHTHDLLLKPHEEWTHTLSTAR